MIATEPVQRILDLLEKVQEVAKGWEALCPAHDDNRRSLCIGVGQDGRALVKCQANCSTDVVLSKLGLKSGDMFVGSRPASNGKQVAQVYAYADPAGNTRFEVVRYEPKDFKQRKSDGAGGYVWKMEGVKKVIYHLPQVLEAVERGEKVYVVEGEKAADALVKLGLCATCTAGGAEKWDKTPSAPRALRGAKVVVIPDNDEPGRRHAAQVAASLRGVAEHVLLLTLPNLPAKGDVYDWIKAGGTRAALEELEQFATLDAQKSDRDDPEISESVSVAPEKPIPGSPIFRSLDQVEPETVIWFSPGRIPFAKITIMEGDPGLGKTMVMGDAAARMTRGEGLPGDPPIEASDVVILTGEDGLGDTIRPRLEAAGADLRRVKVVEGVYREDGQGEGIVLPRDIDAIRQVVESCGARLIIVDVLNAFLDGKVDSYKDHDIRLALVPFKLLAEATGAAVVLLRHLKKSGGSRAVVAGGGSIGIGGAARSVLLVGQDPADRENKRVLASVKCNLAAAPPSLSFTIESTASGVGRIQWLGQSTETADSLVADRAACDGSGDGESKIDEAVSLLEGWLEAGEKDKKEILRLGQDNGISNRTIERAANKIGVLRQQKGFSHEKRSYWSLPTNPATSPTVENDGTIGDVGTIGHSKALTPTPIPPPDQSRHPANPIGVGTIGAGEVLL